MNSEITSGKVRKGFTVNKSIIRHLIGSQAGNLSKAVEELASNSLDSKSTLIEISIDQENFLLVDNGHGFESEEEIENCFGDFGFDHNTETQKAKARQIGTFGLGRGQAFNFMRSLWITNKFTMEVDLRDDDSEAAYTFESHEDVLHQGCKIEGEFYERLQLIDINNVTRDLEDHLKYISGVKIMLNGKQLNTPPSKLKWDVETDDFYFKQSNHTRGVEIYNMGVYVQTLSHYMMGLSGQLISKKGLQLNMARNSWLEIQCPMYKVAKKFLLEIGGNAVTRKKTLKNEDRQYLICQFLAGETDYREVSDKKIIRGVNGKYYSFAQLEGFGTLTVAPSTNSQLGENLIRDRIAFCFCPNALDWFSVSNTKELLEKLENLVELNKKQGKSDYQGPKYLLSRLSASDFKVYNDLYNGDYMLVPKKDYTSQEKAAVTSFISKIITPIAQAVSYAANTRIKERAILVGESELAEAWTNGRDSIIIDRKILTQNLNLGVDGAMYLIELLLHEYCHDISSSEEHAHGEEFYKRFHDAAFHLKRFHLGLRLSKEYFSRCEKENIPFKRALANSIDLANKKIDALPME